MLFFSLMRYLYPQDFVSTQRSKRTNKQTLQLVISSKQNNSNKNPPTLWWWFFYSCIEIFCSLCGGPESMHLQGYSINGQFLSKETRGRKILCRGILLKLCSRNPVCQTHLRCAATQSKQV